MEPQQRTPFHPLHTHSTFSGVVGGCSFHLPPNLFCSLLYSIFSSLVTVCFKNKTFFVTFQYRTACEKKIKKAFFASLVWNPNIKVMNTGKLVQLSQCWIWMSLVYRLPHMWYNVDCSQLTSQFAHYQLQLVYPAMGHRPQETSSRKLCKPLLAHLISHCTFSIHCTKLSFIPFQLCFYLS